LYFLAPGQVLDLRSSAWLNAKMLDQIGVAGRGLTATVSWGFRDLLLKALVRLPGFLQFQTTSINNPYAVTCLTGKRAASNSFRLL
jgi:hypothetical protein